MRGRAEDIHPALTHEIVGAAMRVHSALGPGLLESAYEACLAHELSARGHDVLRQVAVPITYEGVRIDAGYRLDMLVERTVIVEVKSVARFERIHESQLLTYLRLSGHPVGLLMNFNVSRLRDGIVRRVLTRPRDQT